MRTFSYWNLLKMGRRLIIGNAGNPHTIASVPLGCGYRPTQAPQSEDPCHLFCQRESINDASRCNILRFCHSRLCVKDTFPVVTLVFKLLEVSSRFQMMFLVCSPRQSISFHSPTCPFCNDLQQKPGLFLHVSGILNKRAGRENSIFFPICFV